MKRERFRKHKAGAIFYPSSVAVIGASTRPQSVGRAVFANILFSNFNGIVYPVNPKARGILGVRAYHSVWDIPGEVDLAVIITPANQVPKVLEDCGEKNIKAAIVISAGFKEIGGAGKILEEEVRKIAGENDISLVGPNCLGVINTDPSLSFNATFAQNMPIGGNIAFISQSGALGVAVLDYAARENIGLSKFISIGNKADITENDILSFLRDDDETDVILLYLEDLIDPKGFLELASEITRHSDRPKPILAIKSGRTREGAGAAASHTGALASSDKAYDSFFHQCGVMRVESIQELFDYAVPFAHQPLPKGRNIAIITNAGGPGIMATDACIRHGLKLSKLSEATINTLKEGLPPTASLRNPIDVIGDAGSERFEIALKSVLSDDSVDGSIIICVQTLTDMQQIISTIAEIVPQYEKPAMVCCMGITDISEVLSMLDEKGLPRYRFPESAAKAFANMVQYSCWLRRARTEVKHFEVDKEYAREIIDKAKSEGRSFLPEPEATEVLKAYGFPVLESRFVTSEIECIVAGQEIGFPLVIKIVSPDILHKFDIGGVEVDIRDEKQLKIAYNSILERVRKAAPEAKVWGIFVQKMAEKGKEIILGINRDPNFGVLLMFGMGGTYVEVRKDVTFRIVPIEEQDSFDMMQEIRGSRILHGFRGEPPSDINAIAECLQRLSQLAQEFPEISEIDINPLFVLPEGKGAQVVDARILLKEK